MIADPTHHNFFLLSSHLFNVLIFPGIYALLAPAGIDESEWIYQMNLSDC